MQVPQPSPFGCDVVDVGVICWLTSELPEAETSNVRDEAAAASLTVITKLPEMGVHAGCSHAPPSQLAGGQDSIGASVIVAVEVHVPTMDVAGAFAGIVSVHCTVEAPEPRATE